MFKGIDVSAHQGRIDWEKVQNSGIQFAILRLGIGSNMSSQDDAYFEANVQGCESVGLPWGAYLYSYALNLEDARSEVQHALRLLNGKRPEYPVFFDMEDADGYKVKHGMPSNQGLVDICKTFLLGVEDAVNLAAVRVLPNFIRLLVGAGRVPLSNPFIKTVELAGIQLIIEPIKPGIQRCIVAGLFNSKQKCLFDGNHRQNHTG